VEKCVHDRSLKMHGIANEQMMMPQGGTKNTKLKLQEFVRLLTLVANLQL